jgi:hypothetical protein
MNKLGLTKHILLNLPSVIASVGRPATRAEISAEYLRLEGVTDPEHYKTGRDSRGRTSFDVCIGTGLTKAKKQGIIKNPQRGLYTVAEGQSVAPFQPWGLPPATPTPVEEEAPVSVKVEEEAPAPVKVEEEAPAPVKVEEEAPQVVEETPTPAPVEEVKAEEVKVEVVPDEEVKVEPQAPTRKAYDLTRLDLDPANVRRQLKDGQLVSGSYHVSRQGRDLIITDPSKAEAVAVNMDDLGDNPAVAKYTKMILKEFDEGATHNAGSKTFLTLLSYCRHQHLHTDPFGGLVEACEDENCPIHSVFNQATRTL